MNKLTKIISTGIERGWESNFIFNGTFTYHILEQVLFIELIEKGGKGHEEPKKKLIPHEAVLLSKEFAKCYFGDEEWRDSGRTSTHLKCSAKIPCQSFDLGYMEDQPKYCVECGSKMIEFQHPIQVKNAMGWERHLQQAVIADDLIEYYEKNLQIE